MEDLLVEDYCQEYRGFNIKVYQSVDSDESPRNWDNLGTMICFHSRYSIGDINPPGTALDWFCSELDLDPWDIANRIEKKYSKTDLKIEGKNFAEEVFNYALEKFARDHIFLDLFLYDHGTTRISTCSWIGKAKHAEWDSGQIGIIYVTKETVRKKYNWKYLTDKRIKKIEEYLKKEVEIYDNYLAGFVYGYVAENPDGEMLDSCWGFFGDPEISGLYDSAKSAIDYHISNN